jgi:DNA-binding transcriptional LysR family regulator
LSPPSLATPLPANSLAVANGRAPFRVSDFDAQLAAVRQGVGMTVIPCFVGDGDPILARVPGTEPHPYGTLWLLTQGETRKTRRVRLLSEFLAARLAAHTKRLTGSLD